TVFPVPVFFPPGSPRPVASLHESLAPLHRPPASRRRSSALPHSRAASGKTLHAPAGSLRAVPQPPDSGRGPAWPAHPLSRADMPGSQSELLPGCYDPRPGDATTAPSPISSAPDLRPHTNAPRALVSHPFDNGADYTFHITLRLYPAP